MRLHEYGHSYSPQIEIFKIVYCKDLISALYYGLIERFKINDIEKINNVRAAPWDEFDISHSYNGKELETLSCEFFFEDGYVKVSSNCYMSSPHLHQHFKEITFDHITIDAIIKNRRLI